LKEINFDLTKKATTIFAFLNLPFYGVAFMTIIREYNEMINWKEIILKE
jgi:hypothetical protein